LSRWYTAVDCIRRPWDGAGLSDSPASRYSLRRQLFIIEDQLDFLDDLMRAQESPSEVQLKQVMTHKPALCRLAALLSSRYD
jgi:hypothetical protein